MNYIYTKRASDCIDTLIIYVSVVLKIELASKEFFRLLSAKYSARFLENIFNQSFVCYRMDG